MNTRRGRRQRSAPPSRDRWVIPYADFVTLLFAFFTALYAVASVDASKLSTLADGMRAAVGDREAGRPPVDKDGVLPSNRALVGPADLKPLSRQQAKLREIIERELGDDLLHERLELIEDRRGLVLAVPEAFAFENGKAEMSPGARVLMARMARVLVSLPNAVRVEGHTDNTPIHTARFTSNFELSTARATDVVAFFINTGGVPAARLSAAGYSEFHPRAANDSPTGRARNRRVDIVILNPATEASEEP